MPLEEILSLPLDAESLEPAPFIDESTHFSAAQKSAAFYPAFRVQSFYLTTSGLRSQAVAGGPGLQARVVRLHSPLGAKVVVWEAMRFVEKPVLPHWDTGNANEVLEAFLIIPGSPVLLPGGRNFLHRCEGIYKYILYAPLLGGDSFPTGTTPLYDVTAEALKMEGFQFDPNLLRCSPPNGFTGSAGPGFIGEP